MLRHHLALGHILISEFCQRFHEIPITRRSLEQELLTADVPKDAVDVRIWTYEENWGVIEYNKAPGMPALRSLTNLTVRFITRWGVPHLFDKEDSAVAMKRSEIWTKKV